MYALSGNPRKFTELLHRARTAELCKLLLETCQIHYHTSVGCESKIFLHDFFSFAAATSLVSEASKLSEKVSLQTVQEPWLLLQIKTLPFS